MITITSNADAGAGTLRDALAAAGVGEEIQFSAGVVATGFISLTTGELVISQDQIITGPNDGNFIITSAGARIFHTAAGIISITGLIIGQGIDTTGGALFNETTLTLSNVKVASSQADTGGGIYNNATITMTDCVVQDCGANVDDGGGIYNSGTIYALRVDVINCLATNNGGGVWNSGTFEPQGVIVFPNSVPAMGGNVTVNESGVDGGGFWNSGTLVLSDMTIDDNTADSTLGSGIYDDFGSVQVTRTVISNGTGIAIFSFFGTVSVDNSTISGNTDAAIYNSLGACDVNHSTLTKNFYGVIQDIGSVFYMQNTILAGNTIFDLDTDPPDFISNGNNLFGVLVNGIAAGPDDQFGLSFVDLVIGPLQDNGGPTFTHALLGGSPARDAGNPVSAPATDQRGEPRIMGPQMDIGAFEAGCLVFTGTLPSWLTIQGNCLVVTSGSFRASTKAAANAAAQAALDTFVAAALASGDLVCNS